MASVNMLSALAPKTTDLAFSVSLG